uniref:Uncharacterized protein n=1 Tax=Arundo donax TaxID=35708 RepID=A0A0A8YXP3_ARUDO
MIRKTVAEVGDCKYASSGAPYWKRVGDVIERLNRWPVPKPYWRRRNDPESKDEADTKERYGYIIDGQKFFYL